jgi:hypothetical protein
MMASRPTVRVKVSPKFPAQVAAGEGITIDRSGGVYTFAATGTMAGPETATDRAIAVFDGSTGQLLDDSPATISGNGTLSINPTPASTNRGVVVTQSSPTSGSTQGEFRFSEINVTSAVKVLPGSPSTQLPFADNVSTGLKITMTEGANAGGFQIPLLVRLNHTVDTAIWGGGSGPSDHIVFAVQGQSSAADTSIAGGAGYYAISAALYFEGGAEHTNIVVMNPELSLDPAVVVEYSTALRLQKNNSGSGSISDAAITTYAFASGCGWKNFVNFSEDREAQSILATGNIFNAQQALTVANFANLSNMTVTSSILKFPRVNLTGGGVLTLNPNSVAIGSVPSPISGTVLQVVATDAASGAVEVDTFGSGASVVPIFRGARARGTAASRTAVQAGDALVSLAGTGYNGTTTPVTLAGVTAFAEENFTGAACGSKLTFFTTPAGSTTAATRGQFSASGVFTVTQNAAAAPAPLLNSLIQVAGADSTTANIEINTYGSGATVVPIFRGQRSRGTAASRATVQADDALAAFGGAGFDGTQYNTASGALSVFAAEMFSGSARGTYLTFAVTPTSSTTVTTAGAVEHNGGLTWPRSVTGGSKGTGTINATQIYEANARVATLAGGLGQFTATTSADLKAVISDETGSGGALVFATSPTLTTPTFSTSFTSPLHIGGTSASSTLTLESTSGSGTSDAVIFLTGSQVEAGRVNTSQQWVMGPNFAPTTGTKLLINANTVGPQSAASEAGTLVHLTNANASSTRVTIDSFGSAFGDHPSITYRASRGTQASPTATQNGDFLGSNFGKGRGSAGAYLSNAGAGFIFVATEAYTTTGGARIDLYATADGASSVAKVAQFDKPATATQTGLMLWDVDNNTLERVTVGAADSGGAGFKVLRIQN